MSQCGINHMFCSMRLEIYAGILFFLFFIFFIRLYQALLIDRKMYIWEKTSIDIAYVESAVSNNVILKTIMKRYTFSQSTWPLQESNTSGDISFTCCLPMMSETTSAPLSQMFNIKYKLSLACKFVQNYFHLISPKSGKNLVRKGYQKHYAKRCTFTMDAEASWVCDYSKTVWPPTLKNKYSGCWIGLYVFG